MALFVAARKMPDLSKIPAPALEMIAAERAIEQLRDLQTYIEHTQSSLGLYTFAKRSLQGNDFDTRRMISEWQFIAARDMAMNIYHFAGARQGINMALNECPVLSGLIKSKLTHANDLFNSSFPTWEEIRHAGAHVADMKNAPHKVEQHSFKGKVQLEGIVVIGGEDSSILLGGNIVNDVYSAGWRKRVVSCDIKQSSIDKLVAVRDAFFEAFESAEVQSPS